MLKPYEAQMIMMTYKCLQPQLVSKSSEEQLRAYWFFVLLVFLISVATVHSWECNWRLTLARILLILQVIISVKYPISTSCKCAPSHSGLSKRNETSTTIIFSRNSSGALQWTQVKHITYAHRKNESLWQQLCGSIFTVGQLGTRGSLRNHMNNIAHRLQMCVLWLWIGSHYKLLTGSLCVLYLFHLF